MRAKDIPIGSHWMDAWQNMIRVDKITNHSAGGARIHAFDLLAETPCPHLFRPDQFEEIRRNGKGRRQMGFQMVSRTGRAQHRIH